MTTSRRDLAYGRRGGRIVEWTPPATSTPCTVCGRPVFSGEASHRDCTPPPDDDRLFT